jgi:hypothetical protein
MTHMITLTECPICYVSQDHEKFIACTQCKNGICQDCYGNLVVCKCPFCRRMYNGAVEAIVLETTDGSESDSDNSSDSDYLELTDPSNWFPADRRHPIFDPVFAEYVDWVEHSIQSLERLEEALDHENDTNMDIFQEVINDLYHQYTESMTEVINEALGRNGASLEGVRVQRDLLRDQYEVDRRLAIEEHRVALDRVHYAYLMRYRPMLSDLVRQLTRFMEIYRLQSIRRRFRDGFAEVSIQTLGLLLNEMDRVDESIRQHRIH